MNFVSFFYIFIDIITQFSCSVYYYWPTKDGMEKPEWIFWPTKYDKLHWLTGL